MDGAVVTPARLTVGELARASGVAPSAVRFYETHGLLHGERTAGNQRRFREADVCRTKVIRVAQRVGLSIAEIRALFDELPADPAAADWERLTDRLVADAERRIRDLRATLDEIAATGKLCEIPPTAV